MSLSGIDHLAKQFIEMLIEFDMDIYFSLVKNMVIYDGGRVVVNLLDGTEIECLT